MICRRKLPPRRPSVIEKLVLYPGTPEERRIHCGLGIDPAAARVGDIWLDGPKASSHEQAALHDAAAVVSVALQHGIPAAVLSAACDRPDGESRSALAAALARAAALDAELGKNKE